ncbi:MAG: NYN domain-containing protein [Chlorobiaceae bacterium]|nr:NYN domain-containing protein [Chlorobiaceae bacterium]
MEQSKDTIAMLIDADNSPSDKIDFVLAEMAKYGVVNIRRAYGNWKSRSLSGWEDKLHDYAIRPIQQFDYTKGKNATDMAMTIDAMDLLYGSKLDAFCIVSSDSDFTPLVMRILAEGLHVYGFGQKSTPSPFVNACSTFLYLESVGDQEKSKSDGGRRKTSQELKGDSKLLTLIRNAVDSAQEEDGWSNLAKIGKNISNQASFDPRNYGFKRLSDLVRSIDLFEFEFRNKNSELYVRDKRKGRRPEQGAVEPEASLTFAEAMRPDPARFPKSRPESAGHEFSRPQQEPSEPVRPEPVWVRPERPEPAAAEPVSLESEPAELALSEPAPEARPERPRRRPARSKPSRPEPVPSEPAAAEAASAPDPEPEPAPAPEAQERPKRKPRRPARKKAEPEAKPDASEPSPASAG